MADNGNVAVAILLMLALILAGFVIIFNWIPALGLGLNNIVSIQSGIWIVVVKLVGIALIIVPAYVIINLVREATGR